MEGRGEENGDSRGDFDTGIFLKTVNVCINDDLGSPVVYDFGGIGKSGGQATIANGQIAIQYTKLTMPLMTNYIIRFQYYDWLRH